MSLSDQELVAKSCQGNIDAFEELVKRYEKKVYSIAYRLIGNHADASDMAQEAFIKIYKALPNFRGEASFQTWMYHIVTNACKDELRKRKVNFSSLDEPSEQQEGFLPKEEQSGLAGPEEQILQKESQREIQDCLNTLSGGHRLILVMREIQGFSYEEIANHLGCSLGTVKSRLSRARLAFKEVFLAQKNYEIKEHPKKGKEGEIWIVKK